LVRLRRAECLPCHDARTAISDLLPTTTTKKRASMRALQLIDDRQLETVDLPEPASPGPGEVTVRIRAVALNHIDVWGWRGMAFARRRMPLVIGAEASGEVEAIGPAVAGLLPGQLVSI